MDNYITYSELIDLTETIANASLQHHGVKGMKWGKRKAKISKAVDTAVYSPAEKSRNRKHVARINNMGNASGSSTRRRSTRRRGSGDMTGVFTTAYALANMPGAIHDYNREKKAKKKAIIGGTRVQNSVKKILKKRK